MIIYVGTVEGIALKRVLRRIGRRRSELELVEDEKGKGWVLPEDDPAMPLLQAELEKDEAERRAWNSMTKAVPKTEEERILDDAADMDDLVDRAEELLMMGPYGDCYACIRSRDNEDCWKCEGRAIIFCCGWDCGDTSHMDAEDVKRSAEDLETDAKHKMEYADRLLETQEPDLDEIVALRLKARWLVGRARQIRDWLLPRAQSDPSRARKEMLERRLSHGLGLTKDEQASMEGYDSGTG